jgi:hypothetical protein
VLLGSVNDATGTDSATPMVALAKSLAANGKLVIALPELPRATTGGGWDASRVSQHLRVRQAILDLQGTPGIIVADPWPYMADPAGNGGPLPGILFDVPALHPAPLGHYYIGRAIADVVNTIMPAPSLLPVVNGGFFNATFGVNCMLNTNPLLTGTAGTVSGAGVTGSVADGWTATATANLTVAASKVMKNGVEWQQFIVSGTAADANQQLTLTQAIPVGNVTTGDKLETVCQIDVDAGTAGLWGPSLEVTPTGPGSFLSSTNWNSGGTSSGPPVNVAHTGVLRAPNYPVTSGLTQLLVGITCRAVQSVACSATFRVRSIGCRKLV